MWKNWFTPKVEKPLRPLIERVAFEHGISTFVETGTYLGTTAAWASRHFETVHTIEAAEVIYAKLKGFETNHPNVRRHLGDSGELLPQLAMQLDHPCVFWLDGHWSGEETFGEEKECPILQELESLNRSKQPHFIMVDDARFFTCPPPKPHRPSEWPNLSTLLRLLEGNTASPRTVYLVGDIFLAVPQSAASFVADWLIENHRRIYRA